MLGDIEIEKNKFYHYKRPVPLRNVDIEKVLVSSKISVGEKIYKNFIGYLYNGGKVKPVNNKGCSSIQFLLREFY